MVYIMICKERNKFIVAGNQENKKTNVQYKFRTTVPEVSSFVGNPVKTNTI